MENASKALLIAAALLIVLLIIAFGMVIFRKSQGVTGGADEMQVSSFNEKWTKYEGTQTSTTVKSLLQEAMINNTNDSSFAKVNINGTPITDASNPGFTVTAGTKYTVKLEYVNGQVNNIIID